MKKLLPFYLFVLLIASETRANSDSLWSVWQNPLAHDTARLESLNKYIWAEYLFYDPDSAYILAQNHYDFALEKGLEKYMGQALGTQGVSFAVVGNDDSAKVYYEKSLVFFEKAKYKKGIASISNNLGTIYYNKGQLEQAIGNYKQSMEMMESIGNTKAVAKAQSNIGQVYADKGDYTSAIEYYYLSYGNASKINDSNGMISAINNIAILYDNIKEYEKAIDYFKQCLELIDDHTENKLGLRFNALHNLGTTYSNMGQDDLALNYYMQSLALKMEIDNPTDIASTLHNIGSIFLEIDSLDLAMDYFNRSLHLYEENDETVEIVFPINSIANVYFQKGQYQKALKWAQKGFNLAQKNEVLSHIATASDILYQCHKKLNQLPEALEMLELHERIQDTLESAQNQRDILRYSYRYEYDKKVAADSLKALEKRIKTDAQIATQQAQLDKERTQRFALYGGVGILILFGGFMFNRFRASERQKSIIEEQKDEVESQRTLLDVKNREILDSIIYAKRIQSAILPPVSLFKTYLGDSFVFYQPKDVVAGDFYWLRKVDDTVYFAAADCTGHGVPGALVSMVCNNALNRSIREYGLSDPGEILDRTREIVLNAFEKADEEVKDGMDIALCVLEDNILKYAGANNPLWILRRNRLEIIKANRQPIGNYVNPQPYTTHRFELQEGDTIYLFTDGITDQFGGPEGKKFKIKAFQELLLSIQYKDMPTQKQAIKEAFTQWKGDLDQVDDICIIGYRH